MSCLVVALLKEMMRKTETPYEVVIYGETCAFALADSNTNATASFGRRLALIFTVHRNRHLISLSATPPHQLDPHA